MYQLLSNQVTGYYLNIQVNCQIKIKITKVEKKKRRECLYLKLLVELVEE